MNARERGRTGRRGKADGLRARAAAIRAEIDAQDRAVQDRRESTEAGALEQQARELDLEQDRIDKAAELRAQASAADASAAELDVRVRQLNVEMVEAAIRAARFEEQLAVDVVGRRQGLEQRSAQAAEAGDADAILAAERDIALLPALEARLREQAEAAAARTAELNDEAGKAESRAYELRRSADALRRWAAVDALSASPTTIGYSSAPRTFESSWEEAATCSRRSRRSHRGCTGGRTGSFAISRSGCGCVR